MRRIRHEILSGALAPGERLIEEQLTQRFGTSRAPLREALRSLGQQGLVEHLPQRGRRLRGAEPGRSPPGHPRGAQQRHRTQTSAGRPHGITLMAPAGSDELSSPPSPPHSIPAPAAIPMPAAQPSRRIPLRVPRHRGSGRHQHVRQLARLPPLTRARRPMTSRPPVIRSGR
ncbi:GntR family transcriptional regulator [Sphaerisporangium sp. NPDC049003]|uniref:GntR family transcriptional regulator n=1 Tax=Sphaerisporangium sp. NPDC049003 TaxID=3364517 RepID=UPI003724AE32